jgi:type II secretory pathway pseudopilin PulG
MFKQRRGATILEGLVVMAILAVIFAVLFEIFAGQAVFFQKENARLDTALANTCALNDFVIQTREAVAVEPGATIDSVVYNSGPEQVVLKVYSLDAAGAFIISSFDYIVYYRDLVNTRKLMKKIAPSAGSSRTAATRSLNNYVGSLNFVYDNPDVSLARQVTAYLTSSSTAAGTSFAVSSTARAMLRNR